jgi:hypothetical protein
VARHVKAAGWRCAQGKATAVNKAGTEFLMTTGVFDQ